MQTHTGIWRGTARRARTQVTEVDWMGWRGYERADGGGQRRSSTIFFLSFFFRSFTRENRIRGLHRSNLKVLKLNDSVVFASEPNWF